MEKAKDVASKADLADFRTEIHKDFGEFKTDMQKQFGDFRADLIKTLWLAQLSTALILIGVGLLIHFNRCMLSSP